MLMTVSQGWSPHRVRKGHLPCRYCEDPPWGWKESIQGHSSPLPCFVPPPLALVNFSALQILSSEKVSSISVP